MPAAVLDRTLRLVRLFDASRERVFAAWTDPALFAEWFGPPGVTTALCELDVRAGGDWRLRGGNPEGKHAVSGKYLEVKKPERLVFTWAWHDTDDFTSPRGHETIVTLEFKALGGKTEMTMVQGPFDLETGMKSMEAHEHGWTGSFGKLEALFAKGGNT